MGEKTKIEWTAGPDGEPGATWNPIRARIKPMCICGCRFVSHGTDGERRNGGLDRWSSRSQA